MNANIALVGAGPGDPDLLAVKAARLIAEADVVVHDALVGEGVLALVRPDAELIDVGKRPGRGVPQELINALLVNLAESARRIVRLKGGDPFVFGRGGEEAAALAEAGLAFEVVPGITSAVAAPAAAGIPVTHRGVSAAVTVVTGHRRASHQAGGRINLDSQAGGRINLDSQAGGRINVGHQAGGRINVDSDVDWRSLAKVGGTIVVLMGVSKRGVIAAELLSGGLAPATPVACVHSATTAAEVTIRCRLDELASAAVESPAVLVIGAVAAFDLRSVADPGAVEAVGHAALDVHLGHRGRRDILRVEHCE